MNKNKKINRIKKFFRSSLFIGIILILLSALIEQIVLTSKAINSYEALKLVFKILLSVSNSIGIALIVGYWVDMVKNSEDYIDFINTELQETIIQKGFIQSLSYSEKLKICENLISPNDQNINNHSNIRAYMKSQSQSFLDFFNVNFRSNYLIHVNVYKKSGHYMAEYTMTYRIYKINQKYQPVSIVFEKDSEILSTIIKNEKGEILKSLEMSDYKTSHLDNKELVFEIPVEFYTNEFLTIERKIIENGHTHWLTLNWSNLTPIDGIYYDARCKDGIIKEFYIFNDPEGYGTELDNERKELIIESNQWLNSYSGFSIVIADPSEDDDFKKDISNRSNNQQ